MAAERWRVFLDANVLIAGLASRTGVSAAIRNLGESGQIVIVLSRQVLVETDRIINKKFPHLIDHQRAFLTHFSPVLADDPPPEAVRAASDAIHPGDAAILAAAKQADVEYLVTLNTRHFMTPRVRAFFSPPIVTPAEFLGAFRAFWARLG